MTTQTEALSVEDTLKLALEDLKWIKTGMGCKDIDATIQAIEEVLANHIPDAKNMVAQPEQICGFDVVLDESMPPDTFKLAQTEQEPVAYGMWDSMIGCGGRMMYVRLDKGQDGCTVPLYTTPPQRKPEGDGIDEAAFLKRFHQNLERGHAEKPCPTCESLARTVMMDQASTDAPQRTWVGLTDEERNDCLVSADPCEALAKPEAEQLMEDIEAMLRSKNT